MSLLVAPDATARALAPTGEHNTGDNLGTGPVLQLLREHPGAAVVAPLRPVFVAVDLDGTADLLPHLQDAAAAVGAALVYLAASGSPDSAHAVYACPTAHGRRALLARVDALRAWAGVSSSALDVRGARQVLRMPGVVSLKPDCGPVLPAVLQAGELVALPPADALARALDALHAVGWAPAPAGGRQALARAVAALDALQPVAPAAAAAEPVAPAGELPPVPGGLQLDARAWDALRTPAPAGVDRSMHALQAARHLWRCGGRTWADVAGVVLTVPALARWRARGPQDAARRWGMEAAKWAGHCPDMSTPDAQRLADATDACRLLPAHLEAATVAVLQRMRAVGRVDAVGVAVRDLVAAGVAGSIAAASGLLRELQAAGVLTCARRWEDGPLTEATLWTLQPVDLWRVDSGEKLNTIHTPLDSSPVAAGVVLHPVWLSLGHGARRLWSLLQAGVRSLAAAADVLGVPARTVRGWAAGLRAAGLAGCSRAGRARLWSALPLDDVPAAAAAVAELRERCERVVGERVAWRQLVDGVGDSVAGSGVEDARVGPGAGGGVRGAVAGVWRRLRSPRRPAGGVMAAARRAARSFGAAAVDALGGPGAAASSRPSSAPCSASCCTPAACTGCASCSASSWVVDLGTGRELVGAAAGAGPPGRAGPAGELPHLLTIDYGGWKR